MIVNLFFVVNGSYVAFLLTYQFDDLRMGRTIIFVDICVYSTSTAIITVHYISRYFGDLGLSIWRNSATFVTFLHFENLLIHHKVNMFNYLQASLRLFNIWMKSIFRIENEMVQKEAILLLWNIHFVQAW